MRIHVLDLPDYEKDCKECEFRCKITHPKLQSLPLEICRCECGRCAANGGHPLSPCRDCDNDYDDNGFAVDIPGTGEYRFCEVDEDCIEHGGRCFAYSAWLHQMALHSVKPAAGDEITCRHCTYLGLQDGHPHCHCTGCKTQLDYTCAWARLIKEVE